MVEDVTIEQEPVNIDNNPVEIDNNSTEIVKNVEPQALADEPLPDELTKLPEEPAPKRKPGRPLGSRSKIPGKPRASRAKKVEVIEEPVVQEMPFGPGHGPVEEVPAYEDAPPMPSHPIPTVATNDHEAKILRLLKEHSMSRRQQKVAQWKSWFE